MAVDPAQLAEACGEEERAICRFVLDRTDSVGAAQVADWLAHAPLRIVGVILGAWLLNRICRRVIKRFANRIETGSVDRRLEKMRQHTPRLFLDTGNVDMRAAGRARTVASVLRSICTGIIWTFAVIYVIGELGLNLGPLLAGAGVAGVALGFGAQSLVRDFLSGIFMLIEDQYGVGDVVDVGEATGSVEAISLRVTRLRSADGTVWHVPNGQILRVGNMSQQWARAIVDVHVDPNVDLEHASEVIQKAAERVWERPDTAASVLERPEVLGIDYLGPDAATIRVHGKTRPGAQWAVSRRLRVGIAEALAAEEIAIPPAAYIRPPA